MKRRQDDLNLNQNNGGLLPLRPPRYNCAAGVNLPLAALPGAYHKVQRIPDESTSMASDEPVIETATTGEIKNNQVEAQNNVDIEKMADMVYRMLRQDLMIEMERLPAFRRLI